MYIYKRDGTKQPFNKTKIEKAIKLAGEDIGVDASEFACSIADRIEKSLTKDPTVEEIQDLVEKELMSENKEVAKQYIKYRYDRERVRLGKTKLMKDIISKLDATNIENQNANLDEKSFSGRMNEANRVVMKDYALSIMSKVGRDNHINNEVYIHDLDSWAVGLHNCLTIPLDDLLKNGFKIKQTDIRPARTVNTAMQLAAVIMQLQSLQQFGGVSYSHFDWSMVPYVRMSFAKHFLDGIKYLCDDGVLYDKEELYKLPVDASLYKEQPKAYKYAMDMTEREVYQAVEGLFHNLNSLQSRSGQQLPFSSINFGTCVLPEGRMVTKSILEVSIEGLGAMHKTPIFPCSIFQCMKGVNRKPDDPNYDLFKLALESTSKRLYPNYANCDWSGNAGYDKNDPRTYFSTMGKWKLQLI